VHGNARLTVYGRWLIVLRHLGGMPLSHVADQLGVSRQTASKWWRRYVDDPDGEWWRDRPSTPGSSPHRIPAEVEAAIIELRQERLGPWQIAYRVGVSSSTVWRVLRDAGMNRLGFLDPPTGAVIRYERATPGELIHVDTKKFGRIPDGGGRFALGDVGYRTAARINQRVGYIHVHAAVDDHSRLAYAAVYDNARAPACSEFLVDTIDYYAGWGIRIAAIMTDNAKAYQAKLFTATRTDHGIDHITTRPYRPQTNGKVERFFRTLKTEWSHATTYPNETTRTQALDTWITTYNTQRPHTAIGAPPATRVNNAPE
jgi:transposase InsO family protein